MNLNKSYNMGERERDSLVGSGRTLGMVIKEKDEELALFLEMRKREKEEKEKERDKDKEGGTDVIDPMQGNKLPKLVPINCFFSNFLSLVGDFFLFETLSFANLVQLALKIGNNPVDGRPSWNLSFFIFFFVITKCSWVHMQTNGHSPYRGGRSFTYTPLKLGF